MYLRLLDYEVQYDSGIRKDQLPPRTPAAAAWLNPLGDVAMNSHEDSRDIQRFFRKKSRELAVLEWRKPSRC
jgi:hypothetical protein